MKVFPLLLSHEILLLHPIKGFYIESNGLKIYEKENKELYDFAVKNHFELINKIKNETRRF